VGRDLADLRHSIIEAVEFITPRMLINTWKDLEYCLDICRGTTGTTGAHIEVLRASLSGIVYSSVSQPPGRGLVPGPGINYTGPREVNIL
jgi:hypothetical protein